MKKFLKIFIPLVILGALTYQFRAPLSAEFLPLWDTIQSHFFPKAPCSEPILYNLGTFDAQFNISKDYFLSALSEAETIWEKPFGKQLFAYAPTDSDSQVLKINLIYDYRQQATSKLASLGISVNDTRASYDTLKAKLSVLKIEYEKRKKEFEDRLATWNRTPRTNQREFQELQTLQSDLNNMVDEINALVVVLNRLVSTLNLSVEKYNTVSTSRGESFEEGVYVSDGLTREIDVYEWSNRAKLVRVLAHELGHALNLDHVDDPKAIMYELNQGDNETLTQADLAELDIACGVK